MPSAASPASIPLSVESTEASATVSSALPAWTAWQRILFRFSFITIALVIVPLTAAWYQRLWNLKAPLDLLGMLTSYRTDFIVLTSDSFKWGWGGFAPWGVAALGGVVGAAIWTWFARTSTRTEYHTLYYWLRLVVRYRIALGLLAFGFMKFFPSQMPYPSNTNFQTNLGDYTAYKLYWQVVGVVTWYQIVIGIVEVGAAILFFFRGTTALGAAIVIGVLGNIAHANVAYDGGVHVYSAFFAVLSLFLLVPYLKNIWQLLGRREDVTPQYHHVPFDSPRTRWVHHGAKAALIFLFTVVYGHERFEGYYVEGLRKEPVARAIAGIEGVYNVREFYLNGRALPYSAEDPVRWQQAAFERYSTFSYKVNRAFPVHLSNGAPALRDSEKRYELAGVAGGWRYWHYTANEKAGTIVVQDKNNDLNALAGRRRERLADGSQKEENVQRLTWTITRPSSEQVILEGLDEDQNTLRVVLDRRARNYPVEHSRAATVANR